MWSRSCGLSSYADTLLLQSAAVCWRQAGRSKHPLSVGVCSWKERFAIFHTFDGSTEYLLEAISSSAAVRPKLPPLKSQSVSLPDQYSCPEPHGPPATASNQVTHNSVSEGKETSEIQTFIVQVRKCPEQNELRLRDYNLEITLPDWDSVTDGNNIGLETDKGSFVQACKIKRPYPTQAAAITVLW